MKKLLLASSFLLLSYFAFSQVNFDKEYLNFRNSVVGLSEAQLQNMYARPAEFYIKGFSEDFSVSNIQYLDSIIEKFELTNDELELIRQNKFMVSERLSYSTFGSAFHSIYYNDLPVFITTDAILHALHMSYDKILKNLELQMMSSNLEEYLRWLYNNFSVLENKYGGDTALANGLKDADLYITIAYSLITDQLQDGHVVNQDRIAEIWDLINAEKMAYISLFTFPDRTRKIDFSQFTVRGHYVYTHEDELLGIKSLEPYFRAMMWVGRTDFLLTPPPKNPWETPWSDAEIQRMNIGAFMLNELVEQSEKKEQLEFNETVINYLVGKSDNITPGAFSSLLDNIGITSAQQILDSLTFKNLQAALNNDPDLAQQILSDFYFMDPQTDEPGILPVSYRLSGQRFIIDSYILGNVVFDKLIQDGKKLMRMMPNPLDALFVLGNNDALPLLKQEFKKHEYSEQLANLRFLVDKKPDDFWNGSLYNAWLNGIRELNPGTETDSQPLFMKTAAWHHEKINTQLASWSQLRHDNLLYAKQSYTGGTGCSFPYSYIEPYPDFYREIKQFAHKAGNFFEQLSGTNYELQRIADFFPHFESVMEKLEVLANKQLNGQLFSEEENEWLKSMLFAGGGSGIPPYTGWYVDLFYDNWDAAEYDFTVVDVHTQPTDEFGNVVGKVLHTGTGQINLGVFIATCPFSYEKQMAYVGPTMSYYETITNDFKRLTDQEWEELVWDNEVPQRPLWTNIYLAGNKGEKREKSIELPSQLYISAPVISSGSTLMNVYPNPVRNVLNIYVPQKIDDGFVEIFNANGTLVLQKKLNSLASQTVEIKVGNWPEGMYLIRLINDRNEFAVSKFIKKQ